MYIQWAAQEPLAYQSNRNAQGTRHTVDSTTMKFRFLFSLFSHATDKNQTRTLSMPCSFDFKSNASSFILFFSTEFIHFMIILCWVQCIIAHRQSASICVRSLKCCSILLYTGSANAFKTIWNSFFLEIFIDWIILIFFSFSSLSDSCVCSEIEFLIHNQFCEQKNVFFTKCKGLNVMLSIKFISLDFHLRYHTCTQNFEFIKNLLKLIRFYWNPIRPWAS